MQATEQAATPVDLSTPPSPSPVRSEVSEFYLALKEAPTDAYAEKCSHALLAINSHLKNNGLNEISHLSKLGGMRPIDIIPVIWDDETLMATLGINSTEMRRAKGAIKVAYDTAIAMSLIAASGKHLGTTMVQAAGMYGPNVALENPPYVVAGQMSDYMADIPEPSFQIDLNAIDPLQSDEDEYQEQDEQEGEDT